MKNAITTKRLTFQPVTPDPSLLPVPVPALTPVDASVDGDEWTLHVSVNGSNDCSVAASPSDFLLGHTPGA